MRELPHKAVPTKAHAVENLKKKKHQTAAKHPPFGHNATNEKELNDMANNADFTPFRNQWLLGVIKDIDQTNFGPCRITYDAPVDDERLESILIKMDEYAERLQIGPPSKCVEATIAFSQWLLNEHGVRHKVDIGWKHKKSRFGYRVFCWIWLGDYKRWLKRKMKESTPHYAFRKGRSL